MYEQETEWLLHSSLWMKGKKYGDDAVYVDLGAAHPIIKSLTSFCRDLGWSGLAVDANPDYANDWAAAGFGHHFVCAVLSDQPIARFVTHENSFTSRISPCEATDHPEKWGIKRIEERITVPLNALLEMHGIGKIDLLCADLEGMEFSVLQTLDWGKHRPQWVIAEYITAGEGVDIRLAGFLLGKGYELVHLTSSNIIYRRKS